MPTSSTFYTILGLMAFALCAAEEKCAAGDASVESPAAAPGVSLLQYSQKRELLKQTAVPKAPTGVRTWPSSDPVLDKDYPVDLQPGFNSTDVGSPEWYLAQGVNVSGPNVSALQVSQKADPAPPASKPTAEAPAAAATPAPVATTTTVPLMPAPESPNHTNTTNVTVNHTDVAANQTGCAVRKDPRAVAWFAATAKEGTPCTFGADVRDEGSHCIQDPHSQFGSYGWCFTKQDRSEWGSCNEHCPLHGQPAQLGKKIDAVSKAIAGVVDKLDAKAKPEKEVTTTSAAPVAGNSTGSDTAEAPTADAPPAPAAEAPAAEEKK